VKLASKKKYLYLILALSVIFIESAFARSGWQFLIYMQADNDLYEYAKWDLIEMSSSLPSDDSLEVIIRLDTPKRDGIRDIKIQPSKRLIPTKLSELEQVSLDDLNLNILQQFPEREFENQKDSLEDFIARYSNNDKNLKTAILIWGHGEGFSSTRNAQFGGVALDDYPKGKLSILELNKALSFFESYNQKKVSLLAMDACLMQTIETAVEVKDQVEYFIGSTQIQNFRGLPYHLIFKQITRETSPFDLAKMIPEVFINSANEMENTSATMSAVNTHELVNVFVDEFNDVAAMMRDYLDSHPFEKIALKEKINNSPFFLGNSRDLSTSLRLLQEYFYEKEEWAIYDALNIALATLSQSIIKFTYGKDYFSENSEYFRGFFKAFGIWFPASSLEYQIKIDEFKQSKLYQSQMLEDWFNFLQKLHEKSFIGF
tara:strand:+ start:123710 stop:124999 length:1290 start_codon:yes stop_codon:yes gene_type:complete